MTPRHDRVLCFNFCHSVEVKRRTIALLYLYSYFVPVFCLHCFLRFRMHEVQYVARHDCHKSNTRPLWYFAFQFCQSLQCLYLNLYLYLYLQLYLRMYEGPRLSQKWHLTTLVTPLHRWLPHPSTPFVFPTIVYHTLGPFHTYSLYNSPIPIALSFATIVLNFTLEASNMCSELYTCPNSCTPSTQVLNCTFLLPFVFARLLSCSGPRLMWSMFLQFEPWSAHSKYQLTLSPWE